MHKVICVSVCDHCLGSNNRLSVPISGGRGPGDLATPRDWLARHCEKFTLEGALCWIFSLPIKCGMQHSRRPFEVCCVFEFVCVCMCVFVCLCTLFHFHTQRSFSKDETTSRAGKMGPEPAQLFFHNVPNVSLIPSSFAVVTLGGNEEATNATANYFLLCQNLSSSREE